MDISRDPRSAENEITFADTTLLKYLDIEVVQDGTNEGPGYRAENGRLQSGEVEEWLRSVGAQVCSGRFRLIDYTKLFSMQGRPVCTTQPSTL